MKQLAVLTMFLAVGCGPRPPKVVDETTYKVEQAVVVCRQIEECLEGVFYSEYIDQADCQRDWSGFFDDEIDLADDLDCDFEVIEAQECATATHLASCEQFYENYFEGDVRSEFDACTEIFDC